MSVPLRSPLLSPRWGYKRHVALLLRNTKAKACMMLDCWRKWDAIVGDASLVAPTVPVKQASGYLKSGLCMGCQPITGSSESPVI